MVRRSRRPHRSPARISADVEAEVCQLRGRRPHWGPRIAFELAHDDGERVAPSRATVDRILVRYDLGAHCAACGSHVE